MAKIKRSAKNLESSDNVKQNNKVKQARKPKNKTVESKTKTKKSEVNSPILENNERKLRSCVVKLRRTHEAPISIETTKNKQLSDKPKAASKTKQPAKGAAQGDVDIVKEKSLVDNCNNELRKPSTISIRACVVRVQRTPNRTPSTPFIVPTIDEQKRRRLSKLSLTKKTRQLVQSLAETDNEISLFEPARNSTLHAEALKATTNEANEQKDEDARRTHDVNSNSLSKHDNSSKNLTNRSDLIEEILLSVENDDDDDAALPNNNNNNEKSHAFPASDNNKTQKFFHRTNNATTNDAPQPTAAATSRSAKSIDTIYEFLSQSQTSDSDIGKPKDPTADIVKKLIEEGRVLVAAPLKGCGKSRVKSRGVRKAKDKVVKVKKPAAKRGRKLKKKEEIEKIIELSENESDHDDQHHGDHADNDVDDELPMQPSSPLREIESNENIVQEAPIVNDSRSHHVEQHAEGTFSNLARSVLMQQTERNRVNQRQRLLLEQARKIISTPVQRKPTPRAAASATMTPPQAAASALHLSNLSPIHYLSNARINPNSTSKPPQQSPLGNSSPWRASDESRHLPSVFHFSRGSSNLPSFSSDYIPATPQKPKRYVNKYASLGENIINDDNDDNCGDNNGNKDLPAVAGSSSSSNIISSFSSNDSNAENMPPPKKSIAQDKPSTSAAAARLAQSAIATAAEENENIFNSRQMPNPRRTLAHRSPLKAINIQEVVMLPSWKPNEPSKPATNAEKPATDSHNVSIFGFDEYLDADSSFAEPAEKQQTTEKQQNVSNNNETIRNKLKELRKYRPKTKEVRINHQPKLSRDAAKVFDEPGGKPTQRHIKDMLCSTMIYGTKPSLDMPNNANSSGNAIDHLFNDVELSFNEENPHRTYVAPVKRKRKLRNQFAMFLDSDCSEDDESAGSGDDFVDGNKKKTSDKQHAVQKKKKQRKEATATAPKKHENQEFKEFLNSFNEMCKEVEQYELIVEKSA